MRHDRRWIPSITLAMLLALTVMLVQVNTASAHEGHSFYVGIQVPVERVNASYDKTVDNTEASNMTPRRGQGVSRSMIPTIPSRTGSVSWSATGYHCSPRRTDIT